MQRGLCDLHRLGFVLKDKEYIEEFILSGINGLLIVPPDYDSYFDEEGNMKTPLLDKAIAHLESKGIA